MHKDVDQPLKVAVYSTDLPDRACPQVRFFLPLGSVTASCTIIWGTRWREETSTFDVYMDGLEHADLIIISRMFPCRETAGFISQMLSCGKPVIYETDDLLTSIPEGNPCKISGDGAAPYINNLMGKAALVVVSTDALKEQYAGFARRIEVLPNRIDPALWSFPPPTRGDDGVITIGYAGSDSHRVDLEMLDDVLERIAHAYAHRVRFCCIGVATERQKRLPGFRLIEGSQGYARYPRLLHDAGFDIALAPLVDNPFNRCKSNIKWQEYSACGFAGLYADLPPYDDTVEHGRTGLLVGPEPDQWYQGIALLITHPELRRELGRQARQEVQRHHTLSSHASEHLDAYRELLASYPAHGAGRV